MARTNGNGFITITPDQWAKACADAGFAIHNGLPVIGISGDTGDGYLITVGVPTDIDGPNLARAILGLGLRVGQAGVKASKDPSRDVAAKAANSVINGEYKPQRERDNDVVTREAEKLFTRHVEGLVKAAKADATDDDVAATVKAQSETDAGKAWIEAAKARVLETGTYSVSRKGGAKAAAVAITL